MDRYETHIIGCLRSAIENAEDGVECHISAVTIQGAIDLLKEKPKIVRCKDCKYGSPLTDSAYYVCTKPFAEPNNRKPHDWFCADGKPKDGDGDG